MRLLCLMVAIGSAFQSGCSILVLESGESLEELNTREQVRQTFGEPVVQGGTDAFTTHRKLSETDYSNRMAVAMTMGLSELYTFPRSLIVTATKIIEGQHLMFVYDDVGTVRQIYLDGKLEVDSSSNKHYRETPKMLFPQSNEYETQRENFQRMRLGDSTIPTL